VSYLRFRGVTKWPIQACTIPFEPATHDISFFCEGKKEVPKESWDRNALYFKIKEGDQIVGDGGYAGEPSKIVVW
jgi:hypothetical protein